MDYILHASLTLEDGYTVRRCLSARRTAAKIPALSYADDVALMSDNAEAVFKDPTYTDSRRLQPKWVYNSIPARQRSCTLETLYILPSAQQPAPALEVWEDFCYLSCNMAYNRINIHRGDDSLHKSQPENSHLFGKEQLVTVSKCSCQQSTQELELCQLMMKHDFHMPD